MPMERLTVGALWQEMEHTLVAPFLRGVTYPWEILHELSDFICQLGASLPVDEYERYADGVWVARTARVAPTAYLGGPCIIGHESEVRHGAFVRGSALVGNGAVVGNSVELKNCVLFDGVQVPHYNYVGDSILGYRSHMGAGAITSNVKSDRSNVTVRMDRGAVETGCRKLGAVLGDFVEVGCNSVLNPGTVIGVHTNVYPLSSVRGYIPPNCIYKGKNDIVKKI